jgi:hypothetical protein
MRGGRAFRRTVVQPATTPHPPFGHLLPQGEKAMWLGLCSRQDVHVIASSCGTGRVRGERGRREAGSNYFEAQ